MSHQVPFCASWLPGTWCLRPCSRRKWPLGHPPVPRQRARWQDIAESRKMVGWQGLWTWHISIYIYKLYKFTYVSVYFNLWNLNNDLKDWYIGVWNGSWGKGGWLMGFVQHYINAQTNTATIKNMPIALNIFRSKIYVGWLNKKSFVHITYS